MKAEPLIRKKRYSDSFQIPTIVFSKKDIESALLSFRERVRKELPVEEYSDAEYVVLEILNEEFEDVTKSMDLK